MFSWDEKLLIMKDETVYGADSTPTAAADAILGMEVTLKFMSQDVELKYDRGMQGNFGSIPVGVHCQLTFKVYASGSGAAGTAPAYATFLKSGKLAEVTEAAVSVTYNPVGGLGSNSSSIYFFHGGERYKVLGNRTSIKLTGGALAEPEWEISVLGLWGGRTVAAMPVPDFTAFVDPVEVSAANTSVTLHGIALNCKSFSFDVANTMTYRNLTEQEVVIQPNRKPVVTLQFDAELSTTVDWISIARNGTKAALEIVHGTTAGNIITIAAPKAKVKLPDWADVDKVRAENLTVDLTPDTGNDEFTVSFT